MTTPANQAKLANEIAKVEAARARFAGSVRQLDEETRKEALFSMEKLAWKAFVATASGVAGYTSTLMLQKLWGKAFNGNLPPETPDDPDADFMDALGWTLIIGVGVGVTTFVARRGAASVWTKLTGSKPPEFL